MNKAKSKNLIIGLALIIACMCTAILSGCWMAYRFNEMAKKGYEFDKIIYTDTPSTYITGRTEVTELEGVSSDMDGSKTGWYILETDETNVFDMVFDTTKFAEPSEGLGSDWVTIPEWMPNHSVGYTAHAEVVSFSGNDSIVGLDNSHIFSGKYGYHQAGGDYICLNTDCSCPYDPWDGHMSRPTFENVTTNEAMTNLQVEEAFNGYCITCQYVYELDNGDGTYTYNVVLKNSATATANKRFYNSGEWVTVPVAGDCGNPGGGFDHDGTWTRPRQSWLTTTTDQKPTAFRFNELVLDGYDFTYLYTYITTFDYDELYFNWEDLYNPSDFSYMFSDLPVEKITIKNVKGLGDRAKNLSGLFSNCHNLRSIEFGNFFENCKPTNISKMFYNCPRLKSIDLTTLDTSLVTDMSEMFAVGPGKMTMEERDQAILDHFNNVLIYEYPELQADAPYTLEDLQEMSTGPESYVQFAVQTGLNYPVTYSELLAYSINYTGTLKGFVESVIADPTTMGLAAGEYTVKDIFKYLDNCASAYGLYSVYDANMYANSSREEYVSYIINNLIVENGNHTVETYANSLGITDTELMVNIAMETGLEMPFTYDEFVLFSTEGQVSTISALVEVYNENPDAEGFEIIPKKQDGTDYTLIEFCYEVDKLVEQLNMEFDSDIVLLTDAEFISYYQDKKHSPKGTLTLGGEGSLFVIENDVNIDKLFGDYCYFAVVITPDGIGDDVLIPLQREYQIINEETTNDVVIVSNITKSSESSILNYYYTPAPEDEEPDSPTNTPEEPTNPEQPAPETPSDNNTNTEQPEDNNEQDKDKDNALVIIVAASAGGAVVVPSSVVIGVKRFKKRKKMTIKDQRL